MSDCVFVIAQCLGTYFRFSHRRLNTVVAVFSERRRLFAQVCEGNFSYFPHHLWQKAVNFRFIVRFTDTKAISFKFHYLTC